MKLEEYKKIAMQTEIKSSSYSSKESMYSACMGLMEETGEVIAELRKPLFKGNFHQKKLDVEAVKGEIGDLMWYIALICKNTDINMNELRVGQEKIKKDLPKRERLIQLSIKMGQKSGEIVQEYEKIFCGESDKCQLKEKIQQQYSCTCELLRELGITLDDVLSENVKKINSRYGDNNKFVLEQE